MHISIIIPTSGRCETLKKSLTSLRENIPVGPSFEVLVVCNPCNLKIKGVVESFNGCNFPVKYIGSNRVGTNRARNLGVENSRGENLLFLDDDVQIPHFQFWTGFRKLVLESVSGVAAGGYYLNRPEAKISEIIYNAAAGLWLMKCRAGKDAWNPVLLGGCFLVGRELFQRAGGFAEAAQDAGEEDRLCERLSLLGCPPLLLDELSVVHEFQGGFQRLFTNAFRHGIAKVQSNRSGKSALSLKQIWALVGKIMNIHCIGLRTSKGCTLIAGLFFYYLVLNIGSWKRTLILEKMFIWERKRSTFVKGTV